MENDTEMVLPYLPGSRVPLEGFGWASFAFALLESREDLGKGPNRSDPLPLIETAHHPYITQNIAPRRQGLVKGMGHLGGVNAC